MIVHYDHKLWNLEMCRKLFSNLQQTSPDSEVELEELTPSTYKEQRKASVKNLVIVESN